MTTFTYDSARWTGLGSDYNRKYGFKPIETTWDEVSDILKHARRALWFTIRHHRVNRLVQRIAAGLHKNMNARVSTSSSFGGAAMRGVLLHVDLTPDQRMLDVLPILEELEAHGYEVQKSEDYAAISRRSFYCESRNSTIILSVFVYRSQTCRKVEVGLEPTYELRCEP